jgi:hypothetical protein
MRLMDVEFLFELMAYNACIQTQETTNNCVGSKHSCRSILQQQHQQQSKSALHATPREFYNKAVLELNGLLKLEPECSIDGHPFLIGRAPFSDTFLAVIWGLRAMNC